MSLRTWMQWPCIMPVVFTPTAGILRSIYEPAIAFSRPWGRPSFINSFGSAFWRRLCLGVGFDHDPSGAGSWHVIDDDCGRATADCGNHSVADHAVARARRG